MSTDKYKKCKIIIKQVQQNNINTKNNDIVLRNLHFIKVDLI